MDLKEAELLFKSYGCSHFHMVRELDEKTYKSYSKLNIPRTLENRWANDVMDKYYSHILEDYLDSDISITVWSAKDLYSNWKDEYNYKIFNKILRLTNPQNTDYIHSRINDYFKTSKVFTPCIGLSYKKDFHIDGIKNNLYDYKWEEAGEIDIVDPIYFEEQRANVYCMMTGKGKEYIAIATLKNGADAIYAIEKGPLGGFKISNDRKYY